VKWYMAMPMDGVPYRSDNGLVWFAITPHGDEPIHDGGFISEILAAGHEITEEHARAMATVPPSEIVKKPAQHGP
jgi:hypothetical protein